ncbi:P-loop containing nucleoside triphosphate hydrolase protein [Mycena alexandri]|uniref:ATP-dependent DNA helicase n=1 Tax=Mycena alexandri TaxID=1745969 RepID=A0AAD6TBE5_9AGAR|nr:P-loop containing nucleoside triphosphate hydrolase protein [Mycena alexandri]
MEGVKDQGISLHEAYSKYSGLLSSVFRLKHFRENQLEAIAETTAGRDTFILMPTGAGKSLCYQLPAIFENEQEDAITVVISPLRSLISDQVEALVAKGVKALGITSETDDRIIRKALFRRESRPALLYFTPEKMQKSTLLHDGLVHLYRKGKLARFAVDEAHCIVTWEEFREAYRSLHTLRDDFPEVPIMALTSTASPEGVVHICRRLKLRNPVVLRQSVNRANLTYTVKAKRHGEMFADILKFIRKSHHRHSGIIYRIRRGQCERLARMLRSNGIKAVAYHAGMTPEERELVHSKWKTGVHRVIVATTAFGMGIDKQNVRFVVHCDLPKSLENFYQETGRAGRDGKPAECVLHYSFQDRKTILDLESSSQDGRANPALDNQKRVAKIVQYCEEKSICRRVLLLQHFGEAFDQKDCGNRCDNCMHRARFVSRDVSAEARLAVSLVQAFKNGHQNITVRQCVELFRGRDTLNTRKNGRHRNLYYGAGAALSHDLATLIFDQLLKLDLLVEFKVHSNRGNYHHYVKVEASLADIIFY